MKKICVLLVALIGCFWLAGAQKDSTRHEGHKHNVKKETMRKDTTHHAHKMYKGGGKDSTYHKGKKGKH